MRTWTLLLLLYILPVSLFSQHREGAINGKLVDSLSKKALPLATIAVFSAADTVLITYRMSNNEGDFKVPALPLNKPLRLLISYSGYMVYRLELTLTEGHAQVALGIISMVPGGLPLEEVLVYAERPPIIVKKDTIEFNASSFKTLPTALVEDLLKKLPGVQLDPDGNIVVNGRKVNRILVDGKEFFGGDTKMATRNLPANVIDKVQVTNDEQELEQYPDKSKASIGQVINLRLKKGIKQGWFGKAYAGGGTEGRYEAGAIVNLFRDTLQVSALGFSNNINRPGFGYSDIRRLGGFDRSGISSISTVNGGLTINGISFGASGEGIQRSDGAGFNMNHVFKKNTTLNTQYFYGQSENNVTELSNLQQFIRDTTLITRSDRNEVIKAYNHRISFSLRMRANPFTRIDFRPGLVISGLRSNQVTGISTTSNIDGLLNSSNNRQAVNGNDIGYNHTLSIVRSFKKKGRTFNLYQLTGYNYTDNDQVTNVQNIFYSADTLYLNQLRNRRPANASVNTTLTYNEPLLKNVRLKIMYALQFLHNKDELTTYNRNSSSGKYDEVNDGLTNNISRKTWRNSLSAAWIWSYKDLTITGSVNLQRLSLYNRLRKNNLTFNQHYNYLFPGLAIDWKEVNIEYSVSVAPPGISDIQPVPDNTNPLYIIAGNPALQPVTTHNIYLNFYKSIPAKSLSINAYLNANFNKNGIVRSRMVAGNGIQTVFPVNQEGVQNIFNQANISKQYKLNQELQFTATVGYALNFYRSLIIINDLRGFAKTTDLSAYIRNGINWKDKIEWNLGLNRGIYNTRYERQEFDALKVNRMGLSTDVVIRWPRKLVWESSLDYRYNSQAAPGVQRSTALVNGSITCLFMKEDKGQLRLAIFDLLNQNRAVTRYSADNFIKDRQVNILRRYLLLTFTYNIRNFKNTRVGGRQSLFLF